MNDRYETLLNEIGQIVNNDGYSDRHENANKDSNALSTQRDLIAGVVCKEYAMTRMLPEHIKQAHLDGDIHVHDLTNSPTMGAFNCMLVDLKFMLETGFKMGTVDIKPPQSITVATAVAAQIVAQVASHTYGGTSYNRFDEVMAPYAERSYQKHLDNAKEFDIPRPEEYADTMTRREIYDAMRSLSYELNTIHTSNGQTPFITIGFGLGTGKWEQEIQCCILKERYKGIGKNRETPVFPKLVFTLKDGLNLNKDDPQYYIKELAMKTSARRMYPDILSYDKIVETTGSFKAPMGERFYCPSKTA